MILQVDNVSKSFGGLQALVKVTFDLPEGQILGLIGPNGAGKTTLFNIINGVFPPTEGKISFRGEDVTRLKPYHLAHRGLARTHQIVKPLNELTVLENVMVGACYGSQGKSLNDARQTAHQVLAFLGLADQASQLAGSLNVVQKKIMEMARAMASQPHLLLLDEVLAGLNPSEIEEMEGTVRQIQQRGVTIIIIEHVMHALMSLSDRVIVLDHGHQIAEGTPEEVSRDQRVIEAYLGDPKAVKRMLENIDKGISHGDS